MKNRLLFTIVLLTTFCTINAQVTIIDSIMAGGIYRNYRLYVPTAYSDDTPSPLLGIHLMHSDRQCMPTLTR